MGRTLKDLLNYSFAHWAERTAVRVLQSGGEKGGAPAYRGLSYGELEERRNRLAAGLAQLGLKKGERVGMLAEGGLESLLVFLATDLLGLCAVPLCNRAPAEILKHGIQHSGIEVLVVDPGGYERFCGLRATLEAPPRLVLIRGRAAAALSWEQLMEMGAPEPPEVEVHPADESKIIYTSGSSGLPKGVVQTHANIVANIEEIRDLISRRERFRLFKSAPDYHAMGILNIYYPLAKGWTLDLARSPERVLSDIRYSQPEGLLIVPLVLDKIYGAVRREMEAGGLKGRLVARALAAKQRIARGQARRADRLVQAAVGGRIIARIRRRLARRVGANLQFLILGSAKADPEALDFFHYVLDIATYEGYGTTECAPLIATNHLKGRKVGTVGRPLLEVKLVDEAGREVGRGDPASGLYHGSGGAAGELWVCGPNVMKGYLDDPAQTAKVLVPDEEGRVWYRTGDLFSMDEEGFLRFRGRLGRQFKLRNGEFVNPELLERVFGRAPLVEHVLVWGHQGLGAPVVLVAVDLEEVKKLEDIPGLPRSDEATLRTHPALAERVRALLRREAEAAGLPAHERPQRLLLLPAALSEEEGTLTRGLRKIVPAAVLERYRGLLEEEGAE